MDTTASGSQAYAKVSNVRALVQMLQAIKSTAKQVVRTVHWCPLRALRPLLELAPYAHSGLQHCTVLMGSDGLSVRWEIDSKTLQSSIFLRQEVSASSYRHTDCFISQIEPFAQASQYFIHNNLSFLYQHGDDVTLIAGFFACILSVIYLICKSASNVQCITACMRHCPSLHRLCVSPLSVVLMYMHMHTSG